MTAVTPPPGQTDRLNRDNRQELQLHPLPGKLTDSMETSSSDCSYTLPDKVTYSVIVNYLRKVRKCQRQSTDSVIVNPIACQNIGMLQNLVHNYQRGFQQHESHHSYICVDFEVAVHTVIRNIFLVLLGSIFHMQQEVHHQLD